MRTLPWPLPIILSPILGRGRALIYGAKVVMNPVDFWAVMDQQSSFHSLQLLHRWMGAVSDGPHS